MLRICLCIWPRRESVFRLEHAFTVLFFSFLRLSSHIFSYSFTHSQALTFVHMNTHSNFACYLTLGSISLLIFSLKLLNVFVCIRFNYKLSSQARNSIGRSLVVKVHIVLVVFIHFPLMNTPNMPSIISILWNKTEKHAQTFDYSQSSFIDAIFSQLNKNVINRFNAMFI